MAEFPALNLYTDAFLADTAHLGAAETGAYAALLFVAWRVPDGGLPDDDRVLARLARCSKAEWKRVRPAVMAFWTEGNDGKFRQKRLELEREKARDKSAKAAASARAKHQKYKTSVPADAERTQGDGTSERSSERSATTSTSTSTDKEEESGSQQQPSPGAARASEVGEPRPAADAGAMPVFLRRDPRGRALAVVEIAFPDIRNDLRAYPALTGSIGLIDSWLSEGADLARDVLPAIEAECMRLVAKGKKPIGFGWFADAVATNRARNTKSLQEINHGPIGPGSGPSRAEILEHTQRSGIAAGIATEAERRRVSGSG